MTKSIPELQREIIKIKLEQLKWSERQLARSIGITATGLNSFTKGRCNSLNSSNMVALAEALKIDYKAFLEGKCIDVIKHNRGTTDRLLTLLEQSQTILGQNQTLMQQGQNHLENTDKHTNWMERLVETVLTIKPNTVK